MRKRSFAVCGALFAFGVATISADAQPAREAPVAQSSVPGWDALINSLQALPDRMLNKLPETMRSDPQVRQEVARVALAAVASQSIDALGSDGDRPQFLPSIGQIFNIGQPNADTVYKTAKVTPGGAYRLRGERGSMRMAVIAEIGPRPIQDPQSTTPSLGPPRTIHDLNHFPVDAAGRFDVILSPERPSGWTGAWRRLDPTTNALMMRLVSSDWRAEREPTVAIERIDRRPEKPRAAAADLEGRLRGLASSIEFIGPMFMGHVEQLRQEGFVNKLKVFDISQAGGLPGQFYYEGAYDLTGDEALIVEAKAPAGCKYRSLILTNELYETTDWYNNHSSLNDTQASLDSDGVLRIVISEQDPGVPNWLATAGYLSGAVQGRWTNCDSNPVPSIRKVKLRDVRSHLPAETPIISPEERERTIRDRRAALLERNLW